MDKKKRAKKIAQEVKLYMEGKSISDCATSLNYSSVMFSNVLQRLRDRSQVDVPYKQEPKVGDYILEVEKELTILL